MKYSAGKKKISLSERLLNLAFRLAVLLHRAAAFLIRLAGRLAGWVLAKLSWPCKLGVLCAVLGGITLFVGMFGEAYYIGWARFLPKHIGVLDKAGVLASFRVLASVSVGVGTLLILSALLAFTKLRRVHLLLKIAGAVFAVVSLWTFSFLVRAPQVLFLAEGNLIAKDLRNYLWIGGAWSWLPVFLLGLLFLVCLCLRSVENYYSGEEAEEPLVGDRILENVRTHGQDPDFRVSGYWSTFIHIFVLFILPILMRAGCWQAPYGIPKGSGNPVVQMIKVRKIKKKPKERFVFNPNSAISYYRPDIDDSKIMENVDEQTMDTYQAMLLRSKLGKGGGRRGGWPNGMENARVRFIRLRYGGGDWDQQMGKGADYNFLIKFRELTGFKIARKTESIKIANLKWFPRHRAPPFVYITGQGNISVSTREVRILRWYLLEEGGMIFADNGGGNFNSAFRGLIRRILPDKYWVDIANDDIVYKQPYLFPNGAPPLWHHSGKRSLGIKHQGRWVVFYHQGDINDAWQTGGSGVTKLVRARAFKMGVNVVNYAFNQYMTIHFGD